ncbi:unnamed protein product [Victoria cruziana]
MFVACPATSASYHRVLVSSYLSIRNLHLPSVSGNMQAHAFARNPLRANTHDAIDSYSLNSAVSALRSALSCSNQEAPHDFKVLFFNKGKPLARSELGASENACPLWRIGWRSLSDCRNLMGRCEVQLIEDRLVYLGMKGGVIYWAMDVTDVENSSLEPAKQDRGAYVELRTLMVATDWADTDAMGELAITGHAKALLEWHNTSRFCGHCGTRNRPIDAGRRKQCSNELCKKRVYPRVDPVVIMLVIDKENDRALLSRQSRYVPRMWSCLAGFLEPGESLEEAVRRETFEETGIQVGDVVYHSSQPWPVGPNSMPCQLMVGFFAYANSLEIHVDKEELEDAQWYSREDVKNALTFAEYKKAQRSTAVKVSHMCMGVEKGQVSSTDFNIESGELAPMFVPGPYAIAHHLISHWAKHGAFGVADLHRRQSCGTPNL